MKTLLIIVAQNDFRDEEYFDPRTIFDEAGFDCTVASNTTSTAYGKLGGEIEPDIAIADAKAEDYDALMVVGGPGAPTLEDNPSFNQLLQDFQSLDKHITAICIAPTLLAKAGILSGKQATCWNGDGQQSQVLEVHGAQYVSDSVVVDGKYITADGPASAKQFARTIVEKLS